MQYWEQGTRINNAKYIVEQILGIGGFGITYKVRESRTNQQFAIKTLNYQCQQLPEFEQLQQKFVNETIALASCRHPNIVRVYPQMFQESGLWCMVMEYVEGQDLAGYLDRRGVFSEQEAIELITKVGNALSHVHQQGFLHRDIKPSNILLRSLDLSPILIDFGLAREYNSSIRRSVSIALTESFAPIEQYEGRGNFGAWTDVYALAATLYVLVTKELPIPSRFRVHASLASPKQHNPYISNNLNEAILKGMELQPEDRPSTISEWLELLELKLKKDTIFQSLPIKDISVISPDKNIHKEKFFQKYESKSSSAKNFTENLGNGITINMIGIPAGEFMMGSSTLSEKYAMEYPQHKVKLRAFYISQHPITQAQYEIVMGNNPSNFQGSAFSFQKKRKVFNKEKYRNYPVESVTWDDAVNFCKALSSQTNKAYQLPSESQWEYSCRAETNTQYYFGDDESQLKKYGWGDTFLINKGIQEVGQKEPNRWNLYDMHGLVWEWCQDDWHDNYRGSPEDGSTWLSQNSDRKVIRGGSFLSKAFFCRSSYRKEKKCSLQRIDLGFRIVFIDY